jgi:hypothetical protein
MLAGVCVQDSPVASKIREVFLGEKGLTGAIRKVPLETVFEIKNVKQVCHQATSGIVGRSSSRLGQHEQRLRQSPGVLAPGGRHRSSFVIAALRRQSYVSADTLVFSSMCALNLSALHTPAQVCKEADGYQPHLLAPEAGIRRLSSDALDMVTTPVTNTVQQVYTLLVNAAR